MNQANENTDNKTYVVIKHTDSYYRNISHRNSNTTFCSAMHHWAWVEFTGSLEKCQKYLFDVAANSSDNVEYIDEARAEDIKKEIEERRKDGDDVEDFDFKGEGLYKYGQPFFNFGDMDFEDDLRYWRIMDVEDAYNYYEDGYRVGADFISVLPDWVDTSDFCTPEEAEVEC